MNGAQLPVHGTWAGMAPGSPPVRRVAAGAGRGCRGARRPGACARATAARAHSRWLLDVKGGGTVAARAIIDAKRRSAQLARLQGARPRRDDALVAEIRWYARGRAPTRGRRRARGIRPPTDRWYSATLPKGRAVAMFMTDADLRKQSTWDARLGRAAATADRLEHWYATARPRYGRRTRRSAPLPRPTVVSPPGTQRRHSTRSRRSASASRCVPGWKPRASPRRDRSTTQHCPTYAASVSRIYEEYGTLPRHLRPGAALAEGPVLSEPRRSMLSG